MEIDKFPGDEGRKEAKKPPPLIGLLDKVGDMGVVEEAGGLDVTLPPDDRRVVGLSRVESSSKVGD